LAEHGGGSFRDAIGLLDQIGNSKKHIKRSDVEEMIGIAPKTAVIGLMQAITVSPKDIIASLDSFTERGIAPAQAAKQLAALLRSHLLDNNLVIGQQVATQLLASLLYVPVSPNPGAALELALFNANLATTPQAQNPQVVTQSTSKLEPPAIEISAGEDISTWWPHLVDAIKKHNNTLYGVLRMAHPTFNDGVLSLGFAFGFHAKKISDTQTAAKLQEEIKALTGRDVSVKATHNKELKGVTPDVSHVIIASNVSAVPTAIERLPDLGAITSIFGGGEVLE
jgi:DNA polymerase III gamma/tau subunit